jgi:ABC-2 type transport system ATP-binding protein
VRGASADQPAPPGSARDAATPPVLKVTSISKAYGRHHALRDVSFEIAAGEIVGLVGPNGAGKSTTLRIVCGLLRSDSGSVVVDGVDQRLHPARVRERLGAMIEAPASYPALTAFDHLAYLARIRGCYDRAAIERLLTEVGLPPQSRKPVRQFSLGMKQRLGLAMAKLDSPALLVLDEPMNGLDPIGMAELREQLRVVAARDRVAILVSSHLLHEVEQICQRVLFIRESRLVKEARLGIGHTGALLTVLLVTGDDAAAVALLDQQPFAQGVEAVRDGVECRVEPADVPRIAPVLVAAGIPIHAISPRRGSLEDLYLSHYGAGTEAR